MNRFSEFANTAATAACIALILVVMLFAPGLIPASKVSADTQVEVPF